MKIRSLKLQNYKKFVTEKIIDFTTEGEVNEKTLLVGDNGSGKSSVLQAIVILVASLTRQQFKPSLLDWAGFDYRFLQNGNMPLHMEAEIEFSRNEIEATKKYLEELKTKGYKLREEITNHTIVSIFLDFKNDRISAKKGGVNGLKKFSGYQYSKMLSPYVKNKTELFEKVGNIYWYNEQRNVENLSFLLDEDHATQLDGIRNFLASSHSFHISLKNGARQLSEGEFDFYAKLSELYHKVFPDRKFIGPAPNFDVYEKAKAPDFFLHDGKNNYELAGMSAGERAIFPILMDFARWNINNSIIIIDEIELHLHPPLQQQLIRVLSKLGNNNQFIFTSHSNSVFTMFNSSEIKRL